MQLLLLKKHRYTIKQYGYQHLTGQPQLFDLIHKSISQNFEAQGHYRAIIRPCERFYRQQLFKTKTK